MDTGIDSRNPDIAPNFTRPVAQLRAGHPEIDGPCEVAGCLDPAELGRRRSRYARRRHHRRRAERFGGLRRGARTSPWSSIQGGQDSGFFFLEPTVNALTYAGDAGIDVVNMSFFVDPWLYNCAEQPGRLAGGSSSSSAPSSRR